MQASTVVGYAGSNLNDENGFKAVGQSFVKVGGTAAAGTLTDLRVGGYTTEDFIDDAFPGFVVAQKLDKWGAAVCDEFDTPIMWYWADWFEPDELDDSKMIRKTGWQDNEGLFIGIESDDEELVLGEGVWVQSDNTKWTIQGSGEVYNQTVPLFLNDENGFKLCANPCPRDLKLSETFIAGYTTEDFIDDAFPGFVVAQKLDKWGAAVCDEFDTPIMWYWADWFEPDELDDSKMIRKTGWQDNEGLFIGVESDDEDLALGEAVWVQSDSTQWQFVFPKTIED